MLLRERVADWLDSQDDVFDVQPVSVRLHMLEWQGASFLRGGEEIYYLIGKRPKQPDPCCYRLEPYDDILNIDRPLSTDWYIGGYVEKTVSQMGTGEHPFGNHWILVPWVIEGDPDSRIDDYADEEYERITLTVREYPR
jgi:hypothetical protein